MPASRTTRTAAAPARLLNSQSLAESSARGHCVQQRRLELPQGSLDVAVEVDDTSAALHELVPLARQMADMLSQVARCGAEAQHDCVPCREGCSACCSFAVPLSASEARLLWRELFERHSTRDQAALRRFTSAAQTILNRWPGENIASLKALSQWYEGLHLPCPLLDGERCSSYAQRPLVCREFLATASGSHARCGQDAAQLLSPPLSMSLCLQELTCRMEGESPAIFLPLVPAWMLDRMQPPRVWPARQLVHELLNIVAARAAKAARNPAA